MNETPDPIAKPGWVYVVAIVNGGPTKIGISYEYDPRHRIAQIEKALPFDLEIVAIKWADDARGTEVRLHALFRRERIKREWFNLTEKDHQWFCSKDDFLTRSEFEKEMRRRLHAAVAAS